MYKNGKWANIIKSLQLPDGSWGYFHSLSEPKKYPMTTEQAIRRLSILGYTIEDECIKKAVDYLSDCLLRKNEIPDRREKLHNWDIFTDLMFSTWIRHFTKTNEKANAVATTWAKIISHAFINGSYDHNAYIEAYQNAFNMLPRGGRLVDFVNFYKVSIISDNLDERTESLVFDYILNKETGIYYIYDKPLTTLPQSFNSKQASRYLGAIELLTEYQRNKHKLKYVIDWLYENSNDGKWEMGPDAKDGIYFPLSDKWDKESRERDSTFRIIKIIDEIRIIR